MITRQPLSKFTAKPLPSRSKAMSCANGRRTISNISGWLFIKLIASGLWMTISATVLPGNPRVTFFPYFTYSRNHCTINDPSPFCSIASHEDEERQEASALKLTTSTIRFMAQQPFRTPGSRQQILQIWHHLPEFPRCCDG